MQDLPGIGECRKGLENIKYSQENPGRKGREVILTRSSTVLIKS